MSVKLQEQFLQAFYEDFDTSESDIIKQAKENGYFADMLSSLKDGKVEYNEKKNQWEYLRPDRSGRDFYTNIPIWYITDEERDDLADWLIYDSGIEYYNWNADIAEVQELLSEDNTLIDCLFDALDSEAPLDEGVLSDLMDKRFNVVYKGRGLDKKVDELVDKYPELFTSKAYDSNSKEYVEEGLIRSYEYNDGVSDIRNQVAQGKMSKEEGENNLRWMDRMLDESKLNEGNWNYTLKSGVALRNAIDSEDVDEILTQLHNAYDELHSVGIIDDLDFSRAVDDLDDVELADDIEDAIDFELTNLYDLCDNLNVWVAVNSIDECASLDEELVYDDDTGDTYDIQPEPGDFRYDSVKDWYLNAYPDDELGNEINPDVNFQSLLVTIQLNRGDVYDLLGVHDSTIRERVFAKASELLSTLTKHPLDRLYTVWANMSTYDQDLADYQKGILSFDEFSEKHRFYSPREK